MAELLTFCSSLASSPRPADRMLWLRIAVDLILRTDRAPAALGGEFEARFAECLEFADDETRLAMAKKLCGVSSSSRSILQAFLNRSDDAAVWTIAHARQLPPEILRRAASSRRLAVALAGRDDLDRELVGELLASGDAETRLALAGNVAAELTGDQLIELVAIARELMESEHDSRLAVALLKRSPISAAFAPLFLAASPSQRMQILLAAQRAELGRLEVGAFREVSAELLADLERHALERQTALFDADLAAALGASLEQASRIAGDPSGEPLAVALAAFQTPNEICVRILTSRDMAEGLDYRRLGALARLQGALGVAAARTVISAMIGGVADDTRISTPQARHQAALSGRGGAEIVRQMRQRQIPRIDRAESAI